MLLALTLKQEHRKDETILGKFGQLFRLNLDSDILTNKIAEEFQKKPAKKESSTNLMNNSDKSKMNQFLKRDQITLIEVIGRLG